VDARRNWYNRQVTQLWLRSEYENRKKFRSNVWNPGLLIQDNNLMLLLLRLFILKDDRLAMIA
tara:strand:- start:65 stop:253 length:189 start_codon:yes stop_codon:yes gene_type:complete